MPRPLKISALIASAFIVGSCLASRGAQLGSQSSIVSIETGSLRGVPDGDGSIAYRGIPYAAPPVNELRWRPPQPAKRWDGVRNAAVFGHDCMQPVTPWGALYGSLRQENFSEDCLYLNVWTPVGRPNTPLATMVWIYGGSFYQGSGAAPAYNGAELAKQGVIVVTFNYRLGRFGFFAHPALLADDSKSPHGNYGLMDQIAALQWVQRNIPKFGGDPHNVTVFGQSAGGASVRLLLASRFGKGLFARAISESGESSAPTLPMQPAVESMDSAWAVRLGVRGSDAMAARTLRALSAAVVLGPTLAPQPPARPMIDGAIVAEDPAQTFRLGAQQHLPFMVGVNSAEGGLAAPEVFAARADQLLGKDTADAVALYTENGAIDRGRAGAELLDDLSLLDARTAASDMARTGAPTYLYHFSYVPATNRTRVWGAIHSSEIPLVFRTVRESHINGAGEMDLPMSTVVSSYWTEFAKTGRPAPPGHPAWPRFNDQGEELMDFTNDGPVVRKSYRATRLTFLARRLLRRAGIAQPGRAESSEAR